MGLLSPEFVPMTPILSGISSMATRQILTEVAQMHAQQGGAAITFKSVGGVDAARRVQAGEPFDVVVLASDAIDKLVAEGRVVSGSKTDFARSAVAIAVRAGAPQPEIGSEDALRQVLASGGRIGYSTGPSGVALQALFERWGLAEAVRERTVQAPAGVPVGLLLANGEVDLAFQQLSELMHLPGIDLVGPMPPGLDIVTTFSAALCSSSAQPDGVLAFLEFLRSSATAPVKRRHGMAPA